MTRMLSRPVTPALIIVLALAAAPGLSNDALPTKQLIGQKELVCVLLPADGQSDQPRPIGYVARVDTGAATCSIHATDITQKGDQVSFSVYSDDRKTAYRVTADFVERAEITTGEGSEERIKVIMQLRIGDGQTITAEVTLNDRSHLKHGFLLGRNVLHNYWVDVARGKELNVPYRQ